MVDRQLPLRVLLSPALSLVGFTGRCLDCHGFGSMYVCLDYKYRISRGFRPSHGLLFACPISEDSWTCRCRLWILSIVCLALYSFTGKELDLRGKKMYSVLLVFFSSWRSEASSHPRGAKHSGRLFYRETRPSRGLLGKRRWNCITNLSVSLPSPPVYWVYTNTSPRAQVRCWTKSDHGWVPLHPALAKERTIVSKILEHTFLLFPHEGFFLKV